MWRRLVLNSTVWINLTGCKPHFFIICDKARRTAVIQETPAQEPLACISHVGTYHSIHSRKASAWKHSSANSDPRKIERRTCAAARRVASRGSCGSMPLQPRQRRRFERPRSTVPALVAAAQMRCTLRTRIESWRLPASFTATVGFRLRPNSARRPVRRYSTRCAQPCTEAVIGLSAGTFVCARASRVLTAANDRITRSTDLQQVDLGTPPTSRHGAAAESSLARAVGFHRPSGKRRGAPRPR